MRLLRYDSKNKQWIQLFSDSALDKYENLSDLTNLADARKNLEINTYYWSKVDLKTGIAFNSIDPVCIDQKENGQLVTQTDKNNWNQKVDRPIISTSSAPVSSMTEGQIFYNPGNDQMQVKINGKIRNFENNREIHGRNNFAGKGNEAKIVHNIFDSAGNRLTPKCVYVTPISNPQGNLGETWTRKDDTYFYVGNTGSYTGVFEYIIFY